MRAIDTNIIVRYLTGDDPKQADKARALIGREPVFVPRTVLLEVEWVLRGIDFADALHLAAAAGCESFLTFDRRLARSAARSGGTPVKAP